MKTVLFISNIGLEKRTLPNGVNVKNRHMLKYLNGIENIRLNVVDTDNWKLRIIPLLLKITWYSIRSDKIVLSINTNSAYQIIKFLNYMNLIDKLIYVVVGGSLHEQLKRDTVKIKYLKQANKIFVESEEMKKQMRYQGLRNVDKLPNTKYFKDIKVDYNRRVDVPRKSKTSQHTMLFFMLRGLRTSQLIQKCKIYIIRLIEI